MFWLRRRNDSAKLFGSGSNNAGFHVSPATPIPTRSYHKNPFVTIVIPVRTHTFPITMIKALTSESYLWLKVEVVVVLHEGFPPAVVPENLGANVRTVFMPTNSYMSYSQMCNAGASHASSESNLLLFWSPSHKPYKHTTAGDVVNAMTEYMTRNGNVGAVGTVAIMFEESSQQYIVVERGLEVAFGRERNQPVTFLRKLMFGFSVDDRRVQTSTSVTAVSPYCFMVDRELFNSQQGFSVYGQSLIEGIMKGNFHPDAFTRVMDVVRFRVTKLERQMEAISLNQVHQAGAGLRQRIREAYTEVVEATALWEECSEGVAFDDAVDKPNPYGAAQDKGDPPNVVMLEDKLLFYTQQLTEAADALKGLRRQRDASAAEEESGWDLCLRILRSGVDIHAVNVTVEIDSKQFPSMYVQYFAKSKLPVFKSSNSIMGEFGTRWSSFLREVHSTTKHHTTQYLIRVIWDAYCCNCCGFSNEIVHFVVPLHRMYNLNTMLDQPCYCQGFPGSVMDALGQMYITGEQFSVQRITDDEIVVWISHTDPLSYRHRIFGKRAPDYIVGRSMYEFSRIDDGWVSACNSNADEIWVPAEFVKNVFLSSGVHESRVHVIGEAIDVYAFDPSVAKPLRLPLQGRQKHWKSWSNMPYHVEQETHFKFLSNFKWEMRKGWELLFEAYFSEFTSSDKVSLYVMTHIWFPGSPDTYGDKNNCTYLRLEVEKYAKKSGFRLEDLPHYAFITEDVAEVDVVNLYASVDAFVLPTRGEGWGLPAMQAMSMGLPTISTKYGGQVDFMKEWNSFLIRLDGVEELPRENPYGWHEAKRWAMPSVTHLKELMRYVIVNTEHAKKVGLRARKYLIEKYSEEAIAKQVDDRLKKIHDIVAQRRGRAKGG